MSNTIQSYGLGLYNLTAQTLAAQKSGASALSFLDMASQTADQVRSTGPVEAPSLETMLKAKYPNIHYHVFDASSSHWRTRNDYPHYLLYQDGDKAKETLENWQPENPNPFYGSIDGKFTAPKEIHALSSGTRPICRAVPQGCPSR